MTVLRSVLVVTATLLLAACGSDSSDAPGEDNANAAETTDHRVAVSVNASGYEPSEVQATAGEPLTLVFTRTTDEGCGNQVAIPSEHIERDLPVGQPVEVTFTPHEAGRVRFTCGMDMFEGAIVVR